MCTRLNGVSVVFNTLFRLMMSVHYGVTCDMPSPSSNDKILLRQPILDHKIWSFEILYKVGRSKLWPITLFLLLECLV